MNKIIHLHVEYHIGLPLSNSKPRSETVDDRDLETGPIHRSQRNRHLTCTLLFTLLCAFSEIV